MDGRKEGQEGRKKRKEGRTDMTEGRQYGRKDRTEIWKEG
jgi:hypothetical protein